MYLMLLTCFVFASFPFFRSGKSPVPQKRVSNIIEYLTFETHSYSVRGLYKNHKFLFTLLMTLKIDLEREYVKTKEFHTFIKGKYNFFGYMVSTNSSVGTTSVLIPAVVQ